MESIGNLGTKKSTKKSKKKSTKNPKTKARQFATRRPMSAAARAPKGSTPASPDARRVAACVAAHNAAQYAKRRALRLRALAERTRAHLAVLWPSFQSPRASLPSTCACGVERPVDIWMTAGDCLVLVELDAAQHASCAWRDRYAALLASCPAAAPAPAPPSLLVVRFNPFGRGAPLPERLRTLSGFLAAALDALQHREPPAGNGTAPLAPTAAPPPPARDSPPPARLHVVHVCFPLRHKDIVAALECAPSPATPPPLEPPSPDLQCLPAADLQYLRARARSPRGLANPEHRRLPYPAHPDRAHLLLVEEWLLQHAQKVAPELLQRESKFTGFCPCGALRYTNLWMQLPDPCKTLLLVELDAHLHLACTRASEDQRYRPLHAHFGGRVVVLRFNYFSNFGPDESGHVRTLNMLIALTGILRRIEDGETASDIEVFHVHFTGDPPNFPPDLQLKAPYLLAKDPAPRELQNIPQSRTQPGTPPCGATSGVNVVYTGW